MFPFPHFGLSSCLQLLLESTPQPFCVFFLASRCFSPVAPRCPAAELSFACGRSQGSFRGPLFGAAWRTPKIQETAGHWQFRDPLFFGLPFFFRLQHSLFSSREKAPRIAHIASLVCESFDFFGPRFGPGLRTLFWARRCSFSFWRARIRGRSLDQFLGPNLGHFFAFRCEM